jgi:hypothetical protein
MYKTVKMQNTWYRLRDALSTMIVGFGVLISYCGLLISSRRKRERQRSICAGLNFNFLIVLRRMKSKKYISR